jgi:Protein of unknown function, DUF547
MITMGTARARALRLPQARRYVLLIFMLAAIAVPSAQESPAAKQPPFDQILDLYVRDGFVYYRALKSDRAKLDGYLNQLAAADAARLSRNEQVAFWLNAYNAIVLRTVIDHYPIQGHASAYPSKSIRQIPGAFESAPHRVGGRTLTLDDIEKKVLPEFHDPRMYLALGRGAVGSGRLRSEAYVPERIETQLSEMVSECTSRPVCAQIDRGNNKILASAIFSWREKEFAEAYGDKAPAAFANRSPVERAILSLVEPKLLASERQLFAQNSFQVVFEPFDWTLNDLTGRGGR